MVVRDNSFDLGSVWTNALPQVTQSLKVYLGTGNLMGSGLTLYNIDLQLAAAGAVAISNDANNGTVSVRLTLNGNSLTATSTTPTVFGSYGDPRFSVRLDLDLIVTLSASGGLKVVGVSAKVRNAQADSQNFVADVLKLVNNVSAFVGGPNFQQKLEAKLNDLGDTKGFKNALQTQVAAMSTQLAVLAAGVPADASLTYHTVSGRIVLVLPQGL